MNTHYCDASAAPTVYQILMARPQEFGSAIPIFLRRSLRAASLLPEAISQRGDILLRDGVSVPGLYVRLLVDLGRVLKRPPRLLVPGQMILFPVLFRRAGVGMFRRIMYFGGSLAVVVSSRH